MKARIWVALGVMLFTHKIDVFAVDSYPTRCRMAMKEIMFENKVAITETMYIQLAFDLYEPLGPLMYVMSRKPPYDGKPYFVESLNTTCKLISLHLRADDGSKAFLTLTPHQCHGDCARLNTRAVIRWDNFSVQSKLESLIFGWIWEVRLFGAPVDSLVSSIPLSNNSEMESAVLAASRSICRLEYGGNKNPEFDSCVAQRSGQSNLELERKTFGSAP